MKYFIGFLVVVVVLAGGLFAYRYGKESANKTTSTTATSTQADGTSTTQTTKPSTNGKTLDLSNKGLTKVGSEVYGKTDTTILILSNNSIKTLPSEMGKMTKVTTFKIDHNLLDGSLIGEIRQMSQLETLDVSYNKMTGMPAEIGQLSKLQSLNYSYNDITGLPNELKNLKNNLKEFNLTGNPLNQDQIQTIKTLLPNTTIIY